MPDTTTKPRSEAGAFFRRQRTLLSLWRETQYRRDVYTLFLSNLRGVLGPRVVVALLGFIGFGSFLFLNVAESPRQGYEIMQAFVALAAVALGATMYSTEQQSGTFELLWLATGSEKALIRLKIIIALTVVLMLVLPLLGVGWGYYEGGIPFVQSLFFLMAEALFILCLMAFIAALLPQAWAAGLVGLAVLAAVYIGTFNSVHTFNPFLNPVDLPSSRGGGFSGSGGGGSFGGGGGFGVGPRRGRGGGGFSGGGGFGAGSSRRGGGTNLMANRVFLILFALAFAHAAATRLRKAFK